MINTLNESSLHKSMKEIYRIKEEKKGNILQKEKVLEGFICDLAGEIRIVEIQCANLSVLKKKLIALLPHYKITVVYPVVTRKIIVTMGANGEILREKKSPKKGSIYSIFKEMTKLHDIIFHENLEIHCVEVVSEELRIRTDQPEQSQNRRRRFPRNWQKIDKRLKEVGKTTVLHSERDYITLLGNLAKVDSFSLKDLREIAGNREAGYMKYVFLKSGLIREITSVGRNKFFQAKTMAK